LGFVWGFLLVVDASRLCQFHSSESFEYLVFDVLDKDEPIDENDVATTRGIIIAIITTHFAQHPTWPFIGNRITNFYVKNAAIISHNQVKVHEWMIKNI
jgi:hypothetical protein